MLLMLWKRPQKVPGGITAIVAAMAHGMVAGAEITAKALGEEPRSPLLQSGDRRVSVCLKFVR
ncbi:hypothetical protein A6D6_02778 [Alcanivorax xiamenensis]|uniref:Uncharacterized protein n=1 Tax=Alcanivorax xiamenensis TaxID=1177156 RepID=A0ABQ6Y6R1_9GAMM|nr:hypothetical protein A6D6_02778 [Alcanivorax xiamenensis]